LSDPLFDTLKMQGPGDREFEKNLSKFYGATPPASTGSQLQRDPNEFYGGPGGAYQQGPAPGGPMAGEDDYERNARKFYGVPTPPGN
jgi:hypothetical protein